MTLTIELSELKSPFYFERTADYVSRLSLNFKEKGDYYITNCPFHTDKTPSLFLYQSNGTVRFKCFSDKCQSGSWDIFAFIQKIEGCGFIDSVKKFASYLEVDEVILPKGNILKIHD
ncbi:Zinc finger domain-containing protein [Desulfonema limicola]|uniref:Zinc finger domain-containing protein n=1 Tax=Desulfonema limicola TaxID=45656 RepID=A0A975BCC1_9BACT|nr:CHC2 zinc finger domain-containing protein [Desulfonema limicola]QTA82748.1 Zinc finger domain-containing protein [Desulfonema limicola]